MNQSKMAALALVMAPALFACSAKKEPTTAASAVAAPVAVQTRATEPQKKAVAKASESNQGGGITFSEDIKKLCPGVKAPKFGFDSADLRGEWLDALGTLATCMKSGNLAGKSLVLTGHTDPRGTDEYDMALGSERAESVKEALESLGVQDSRMSTTSRGETDARGIAAACSPDGRTALLVREGKGDRGGLFLSGLAGGVAVRIRAGAATGLRWIPGPALPPEG